MDGDVIVNDAQASEQDSARRGGLLYAILAIIILILMTSLGFCTDTTNLAELSAPTINTPDDEIPSGLVIFSGEGEPGSDVEVMLNGRSADTVTVYRDGEWIYSTNLEAGEYDVTVTGPDADGEMNLSSESVTFNVVQSYLAPKLNLPDAAQDANGFVLNGTGTPGSTVEIFNSGISLGTAVVGDDGTWSFDADLSTYRNRFMIRGFDPDGNSIGASPSVELLVDSAAAPLAINTPDIGEFELSDSGLSLSSVTFTGSGEPDSVVDLFVQGEIIGSPMVDGDGNWFFPFTLEGPAGDYSVRGLMFNNEDRDVLLDTELADSISVPVVGTITLGPVENDGNGNLTTSGVTVPGRDVNIWVNGEIVDTVTADADGNWSWMTPTPVGAGEYTVQAQLAEFPDIVSDALSVRVLPFVSLNAPDITLNDDNTGDVTISGRTLPSNRVEIFVDGQYLGETAADADGNWTFIANLSAGAYTIAARAVDVSGSRRAEAALRAVVGEAIGGLELVYAGTSEVGEGSDEVQTVSISGVPVVEIILDASWSMVEPIDNTTRFDIAKEALNNIAGEVLPEGTPTALRIFGNIEGDFACRSDLMVPYGPLDRDVFNRVVAEAEPQFNANTAIGASLLEVVNDLADATEEERIVVLLTDGQETCDGDPAGAIQQLVDAGFNVQVNIVGLAIAEQTLKDEFTRWATIGGGQYYDVSNPGQLIDAMRAASGAFYSVRDENGDLVASSRVGGPTLDLEPGTYTVEIRTSPATVIEEVEIAEGEVLQIVLR